MRHHWKQRQVGHVHRGRNDEGPPPWRGTPLADEVDGNPHQEYRRNDWRGMAERSKEGDCQQPGRRDQQSGADDGARACVEAADHYHGQGHTGAGNRQIPKRRELGDVGVVLHNRHQPRAQDQGFSGRDRKTAAALLHDGSKQRHGQRHRRHDSQQVRRAPQHGVPAEGGVPGSIRWRRDAHGRSGDGGSSQDGVAKGAGHSLPAGVRPCPAGECSEGDQDRAVEQHVRCAPEGVPPDVGVQRVVPVGAEQCERAARHRRQQPAHASASSSPRTTAISLSIYPLGVYGYCGPGGLSRSLIWSFV